MFKPEHSSNSNDDDSKVEIELDCNETVRKCDTIVEDDFIKIEPFVEEEHETVENKTENIVAEEDDNTKIVKLVESDNGRYIKKDEYSVCVALLGMKDSSNVPSHESETNNECESSIQTISLPTLNNEVGYEFTDFFPGLAKFVPVDQTLLKNENIDECYQNVILDHNYDKSSWNIERYFTNTSSNLQKTDKENIHSNERGDVNIDVDCVDIDDKFKTESQTIDSISMNNVDQPISMNDSEPITTTDLDQHKANQLAMMNFVNSLPYPNDGTAAYNSGYYQPEYDSRYYAPVNYGQVYHYDYHNFGNNKPMDHHGTSMNVCSIGGDNGASLQNGAIIAIDSSENNGSTSSYLYSGYDGETVNTPTIINHQHDGTVMIDQSMAINEHESMEMESYHQHHHHHNIHQQENTFSSYDGEDEMMMGKENMLTNEEMQKINSKYTHQRFPIKLWNLATDHEFKPINWSNDGQSLIIDEFALDPCLGFFFRSKKFSSFLRQLHLYGFRKVTRARSHRSATNTSMVNGVRMNEEKARTDLISEYQCQHFQRDRFDLVKLVRRFYGQAAQSNVMDQQSSSSCSGSPLLLTGQTAMFSSSQSSTMDIVNKSPSEGNMVNFGCDKPPQPQHIILGEIQNMEQHGCQIYSHYYDSCGVVDDYQQQQQQQTATEINF